MNELTEEKRFALAAALLFRHLARAYVTTLLIC
jgi:hypothetical protein